MKNLSLWQLKAQLRSHMKSNFFFHSNLLLSPFSIIFIPSLSPPPPSKQILVTIDGKVEFVHSVPPYSYVTSVNLVFVSQNIIDYFEIKFLSYGKMLEILCSLFSVLTRFYLILENMSTNVRKFRFPCYICYICYL